MAMNAAKSVTGGLQARLLPMSLCAKTFVLALVNTVAGSVIGGLIYSEE